LIIHRIGVGDHDEDFVNLLLMIAGLRDFYAKKISCLLPEELAERSPDLLNILARVTNVYTFEDYRYEQYSETILVTPWILPFKAKVMRISNTG